MRSLSSISSYSESGKNFQILLLDRFHPYYCNLCIVWLSCLLLPLAFLCARMLVDLMRTWMTSTPSWRKTSKKFSTGKSVLLRQSSSAKLTAFQRGAAWLCLTERTEIEGKQQKVCLGCKENEHNGDVQKVCTSSSRVLFCYLCRLLLRVLKLAVSKVVWCKSSQ